MREYIKKLGSGHNIILIISNDEMEDVLRIVKSLEDSGLLSEGIIRAGYESKEPSLIKTLIPPYPLTNFEIQKYYQNKPRFIGVYSRDNLPDKIKDGAIVINLDDYSNIETHWIASYVNAETVTYFDSFGVEHIPREIKKFIKRSIDKFTIKISIFRIQAYESVMCGHFCIGFIDFMLKGKSSLIGVAILFSPNDFKKMMV